MKFVKTLILALVWVAYSLIAGQQAHAQTFIVDDDAQCSGANYTRIQDAVNDAPAGATIAVCPGIYAEQLRLDKALTLRGFGTDAQNQAVIRPSQLVESVNIGGTPVAAVVYVTNAVNVNLEGITVDGAANNVSDCLPYLIGVLYFNASGEIRGSTVKSIRLSDPQQAGCQSGVGIFVLSGSDAGDGFSNVQVIDNRLFDYQKAGIAANDAHTQVLIHNNTLTGDGAIATNAQDGIQVAFGARGVISNNTVSDHIYTPCETYENCTFAGKNIIVFQSDDVNVTGNILSRSQLNIRVTGNRTVIRDNSITDVITRDGIFVVGDFNDIISNSITNVSAAAVFVRGSYNTVAYNAITNAVRGVQESSPSSNNVFLGNTFINTQTQFALLSTLAAISGQAYAVNPDNTPLPLSGIAVTLAGGGAQLTTLTDSNGFYSFTNLAAADYTVTPTPNADYAFTPANRFLNLSGANITNADFIGASPSSAPPVVVINRATRQPDTTNRAPINFTVTFNEPVTEFDSSDIAVSGSARATNVLVTGTGANYNVAVSGFTTRGTVTAIVNAGAATDATGNVNPASTSSDNTVTYNAPDNITTPITVTTNADGGAGSLREAITLANLDGGADIINFNLAGGASQIINLTNALPPILETIIIDGATQPGFDGSPLVTLDGAAAGAGANGLTLETDGCTVRGLVITNFGGSGVRVTQGIGNRITRNSIFGNGGLGIDLGVSGVTANDAQDADAGANDLQNYPVIVSARRGSTIVNGTFNSVASQSFTLEFFYTNGIADAASAEGQEFIGAVNVTTDGNGNAVAGATAGSVITFGGDGSFTATFPTTAPAGSFVTATATNSAGGTSEFSAASRVPVQTTADEVLIEGFVRTAGGTNLANVTIRLTGSAQAATLTDAAGHYEFKVAAGGVYQVTASRRGLAFAPSRAAFGGITSNRTADFIAIAKGRAFRTRMK